jgi:hypothetical protein
MRDVVLGRLKDGADQELLDDALRGLLLLPLEGLLEMHVGRDAGLREGAGSTGYCPRVRLLRSWPDEMSPDRPVTRGKAGDARRTTATTRADGPETTGAVDAVGARSDRLRRGPAGTARGGRLVRWRRGSRVRSGTASS